MLSGNRSARCATGRSVLLLTTFLLSSVREAQLYLTAACMNQIRAHGLVAVVPVVGVAGCKEGLTVQTRLGPVENDWIRPSPQLNSTGLL